MFFASFLVTRFRELLFKFTGKKGHVSLSKRTDKVPDVASILLAISFQQFFGGIFCSFPVAARISNSQFFGNNLPVVISLNTNIKIRLYYLKRPVQWEFKNGKTPVKNTPLVKENEKYYKINKQSNINKQHNTKRDKLRN